MRIASILGLSLLVSVGCTDTQPVLDVSLDQPGALVVAGTETPRLFIANTGQEALQVLELQDGLEEVEFVASQAIYFPLRIPSGPATEEMAASEDGRFVVLLDWLTERLKVLDADALAFAQTDGVDIELAVGASGADPFGVVSIPGCGDLCSGRFALSLAGTGAVSIVVVRESDAGDVTAEVEQVIDVGGQPGPLVASLDGTLLFVGDTESNEVARLDLASGAIDRIGVGGVPGPMAVSTSGGHLLVSRPAFRDVVVFDGASTVMQVLDANGRYAPTPGCVPACNGEDSAAQQCPGAHPADLSLCSTESGIQSSGAENAYTAIYLGFIPSATRALGSGLGHPALDTPCCGDSLVNDVSSVCDNYLARSWDEYFAIAGLHGNVTFVGVSEANDGGRPQLLNEGWCNQAALDVDESEDASTAESEQLDPGLVLGDCADLPFELGRFECVSDEERGFGVGLLPGRRAKTIVGIEWEGPVATGTTGLPTLERLAGGGTLIRESDRTYLGDTSVNLGNYDDVIVSREEALFDGLCAGDDVLCGDVVEFLDPLLDSEACVAALGDEPIDGCSLERRIISVQDEEPGRLELDRDLPDACLPEGGKIAYRIRAADSYTVYINSVQYRARPGMKLGLGGDAAEREPVVLAFRESALDFGAANSCERYGEGGLLEGSGAFSRDLQAGVRVYDALLDLRGEGTTSAAAYSLTVDVLFDADGRRKGVGQYSPQLHQGMTIYNGDSPIIFNSYAASDAVIGFVPAAISSSTTSEEDADGTDDDVFVPTGGEFRTSTWYGDTRMYRVIN